LIVSLFCIRTQLPTPGAGDIEDGEAALLRISKNFQLPTTTICSSPKSRLCISQTRSSNPFCCCCCCCCCCLTAEFTVSAFFLNSKCLRAIFSFEIFVLNGLRYLDTQLYFALLASYLILGTPAQLLFFLVTHICFLMDWWTRTSFAKVPTTCSPSRLWW